MDKSEISLDTFWSTEQIRTKSEILYMIVTVCFCFYVNGWIFPQIMLLKHTWPQVQWVVFRLLGVPARVPFGPWELHLWCQLPRSLPPGWAQASGDLPRHHCWACDGAVVGCFNRSRSGYQTSFQVWGTATYSASSGMCGSRVEDFWLFIQRFLIMAVSIHQNTLSKSATKQFPKVRAFHWPSEDSRPGRREVQVDPGCNFEIFPWDHQKGGEDFQCFEGVAWWQHSTNELISQPTSPKSNDGIPRLGWWNSNQFQANLCYWWNPDLRFWEQQHASQH